MMIVFPIVRVPSLLAVTTAVVLLSACEEPKQTSGAPPQVTTDNKATQQPTATAAAPDNRRIEIRMPYTRAELIAFTLVAGIFAGAWLVLGLSRERERWREFEARKDERLIESNIKLAKALTDLSKLFEPKGNAPTTSKEFVAALLRSTADFINKPKQ